MPAFCKLCKISFRRFPFAMQKRDGFDPTVNAYLFQYIADVLFDCRLRNRKLRGNSFIWQATHNHI